MKASHDTIVVCNRMNFSASELAIFIIIFFQKKKKRINHQIYVLCYQVSDLCGLVTCSRIPFVFVKLLISMKK